MVGIIRQAHDGVRADVPYLPDDDVLRLRRPPMSLPCWCVFLFFFVFEFVSLFLYFPHMQLSLLLPPLPAGPNRG